MCPQNIIRAHFLSISILTLIYVSVLSGDECPKMSATSLRVARFSALMKLNCDGTYAYQ